MKQIKISPERLRQITNCGGREIKSPLRKQIEQIKVGYAIEVKDVEEYRRANVILNNIRRQNASRFRRFQEAGKFFVARIS